jgi:hypothetical protein
MTEGQTSNPPSIGRLIVITLGAAAAATALTLFVVLPAEFGRDPTGRRSSRRFRFDPT